MKIWWSQKSDVGTKRSLNIIYSSIWVSDYDHKAYWCLKHGFKTILLTKNMVLVLNLDSRKYCLWRTFLYKKLRSLPVGFIYLYITGSIIKIKYILHWLLCPCSCHICHQFISWICIQTFVFFWTGSPVILTSTVHGDSHKINANISAWIRKQPKFHTTVVISLQVLKKLAQSDFSQPFQPSSKNFHVSPLKSNEITEILG